MKKSILLTVANENYLEYAKQLYSGAYFKGKWRGKVGLITDSNNKKKLEWFLKRGIKIFNHKLHKDLKKKDSIYSNTTLFLKFEIFNPKYKIYDQIIFIDCDVIIKKDITGLLHLSEPIHACEDYFMCKHRGSKPRLRYQFNDENESLIKELKKEHNLKRTSINTGVLVINPKKINLSYDKIISAAIKYKEIAHYRDQSILNLFIKKWTHLSIPYNFVTDVFPDKFEKKESIIIHTIVINPWEEKSRYYKNWITSYRKADQIDFNTNTNKKPGTYLKSSFSLTLYLELHKFENHLRYEIFHKFLGKIGPKIKELSPRAYNFLKKIIP